MENLYLRAKDALSAFEKDVMLQNERLAAFQRAVAYMRIAPPSEKKNAFERLENILDSLEENGGHAKNSRPA